MQAMSTDCESIFGGSSDDSPSSNEDGRASYTSSSSTGVREWKHKTSQARHPYRLRKKLNDSFKGVDVETSSTEGVCDYCRPAL